MNILLGINHVITSIPKIVDVFKTMLKNVVVIQH